MLMRVFTLKFSNALDGFDDTHLSEFIKDKTILSLREHFFMHNERPWLAVIAVYEPVCEPALSKRQSKGRSRDESWRELLQDTDMPMFNTLRDWRSERCKRDGTPPYVICNNKQLAQLAISRPQTLSALMQVDGFGKAKAEKYGQEIISVLSSLEEGGDDEQPQDDGEA